MANPLPKTGLAILLLAAETLADVTDLQSKSAGGLAEARAEGTSATVSILSY